MSNFTPKQQKLADKITQAYPTDEREQAVNDKSLAACGVIAIFYVIVRIIYVGIKGGLALPELVLLFLMVFAMTVVKRKNNFYEPPKSMFLALSLDTSSTRKAKTTRILNYLGDSVIFGVVMVAFEFFLDHERDISNLVTGFIIAVVISFIIDIIYGEIKVKKYNAYMKTLDDEEDEE